MIRPQRPDPRPAPPAWRSYGQVRHDDLPLGIGQVTGITPGQAHILGMRGPLCLPGRHTSGTRGPRPPISTRSPFAQPGQASRRLSNAHLAGALGPRALIAPRAPAGLSVRMVTVRAMRGLGRARARRARRNRGDFLDHVDSASNKMRNPHDHAPGRGTAGTNPNGHALADAKAKAPAKARAPARAGAPARGGSAQVNGIAESRRSRRGPSRGPNGEFACGAYCGSSSGMLRNSLAIIPIVMSPGWMVSVGVAAAIGLTLMKGGSSGSAQITCRLLPNHRLTLSMGRVYPRSGT